jgi:hypothetical protein
MNQTLGLNNKAGSACPNLDKQTDAGTDYVFIHNQIQSFHQEQRKELQKARVAARFSNIHHHSLILIRGSMVSNSFQVSLSF